MQISIIEIIERVLKDHGIKNKGIVSNEIVDNLEIYYEIYPKGAK